jgi:trehalose/maltose hydrolase-like predicted phosphorylase
MVSPGEPITLYFLTVIVTSLNSTQPLQDASQIYESAMEDKENLLSDHVAAWASRWEQGSLEVAGDLHLAQALNSSLYAIRSSIRADWPYGLSPGGLASNAYEGHTFWDQVRCILYMVLRKHAHGGCVHRRRGCGLHCSC